MALISAFVIYAVVFSDLVFVCLSFPVCQSGYPADEIPVHEQDIHLLQFALNLEFFEAEYFLRASYGYGLDAIEPQLNNGGPPPIGARKANLAPFEKEIVKEFGNQEIGHLRAINLTVGGIPRPLLDLSPGKFAAVVDAALGHKLEPPFDPYRDSLNYFISMYIIPYVGLTGYVGANPLIQGYLSKRLLAGLLGVEAGQDAVIRNYLYERADEVVWPYEFTVAAFTDSISKLRNQLGMCGIKDEGIIVPLELGAENRTESNVLSADQNSLSYPRTPQEILRIVYGTGNEHMPGGFYPYGANGKIARSLLYNEP